MARLTSNKHRGDPQYGTRSVFRVVQLTDQALKLELSKRGGLPPADIHFMRKLECTVYRASTADRNIFGDLYSHEASPLDTHVPNVVKALADKFAIAMLRHRAREHMECKKGAASNKRNNVARTLIFQGI